MRTLLNRDGMNSRPSGGGLWEPLEPRLLLSVNPFTFTDVDGDAVRVSLAGSGTLSVTTDAQGIDQILLAGTDLKRSVLRIDVTKAGGGDGLVKVKSIVDDAGLKGIVAPAVDITGDSGAANRGIAVSTACSLSVHDILTGASVTLGTPGQAPVARPDKVGISIHDVPGSSAILILGPVNALSLDRVTGTAADIGFLSADSVQVLGDFKGFLGAGLDAAPKVKSLVVGGDLDGQAILAGLDRATIAGNLTGKVNVPGQQIRSIVVRGSVSNAFIGAGQVQNLQVGGGCVGYLTADGMGTANIAGQVSGQWDVGSKGIQTLRIGSGGSTWNLVTPSSIRTFICAGALSFNILQAQSVGTLKVGGSMAGNLSLTGTSSTAMGNARVLGSVGGQWILAGGVGALVAGSSSTGWIFSAAGDADTVTIQGTMDFIRFDARSVDTLTVTGQMKTGTLHLQATGAGTIALNRATIGSMSAATIRSDGSINSVLVGSLTNSNVLAGVLSTVSGLSGSSLASDYLASSAAIRKLVITATTGDRVVGSNIIAHDLGTVSLQGLKSTNSSHAFGLAFVKAERLTLLSGGKTYLWGKTWVSNPLDDFQVKVLT